MGRWKLLILVGGIATSRSCLGMLRGCFSNSCPNRSSRPPVVRLASWLAIGWPDLARNYAALFRLMPRFRDHDPDRRVLTVELFHPGEDLRERQDRLGPITESLAAALGQSLGRLHGLEPVLAARPDNRAGFPGTRPWLLDALHDVEALSREFNPAQRDLLATIIQSPELTYGLEGLRNAWKPTTLIHGDLKRDNIMILTHNGPSAEPRFIDWELADIGDPAWDVAGLLLTCMEIELTRTSHEDPEDDDQVVRPARANLTACWKAYIRTLGLSPDREATYRVRCIHYLGAKLLLFAIELLGSQPEATPTTRLVTRMARSIMIDPSGVADGLLGSG